RAAKLRQMPSLRPREAKQSRATLTARAAPWIASSPPASRFRSSPNFAARSEANFGIEGRWKIYHSGAALNPKFATDRAALLCELRVRGTRAAPRNDVSHVGIIRAAAAFRQHPGNVAVRVFDVASLAVHAVLRVDDKARLASLLHPFVDARRAIACGRSGVDVVLGGLLQRHVGN